MNGWKGDGPSTRFFVEDPSRASPIGNSIVPLEAKVDKMSDETHDGTVADKDFLEANHLCAPRRISTEAELDGAIAAIDRLIDKGAAGLRSPSEEDYMTVLAKLIEEYEDVHYPRESDSVPGRNVVSFTRADKKD